MCLRSLSGQAISNLLKSELGQSCQIWIKLVKYGLNLSKLVKIELYLLKMAQTCQNFLKIVKFGSDKSKEVWTCQNMLKVVKFGSSMSRLVQTCQNWYKLVKIGSIFSNKGQIVCVTSNLSKIVKVLISLFINSNWVKNCHYVRSHGDWKAFQSCFFEILWIW